MKETRSAKDACMEIEVTNAISAVWDCWEMWAIGLVFAEESYCARRNIPATAVGDGTSARSIPIRFIFFFISQEHPAGMLNRSDTDSRCSLNRILPNSSIIELSTFPNTFSNIESSLEIGEMNFPHSATEIAL